MQLSDSYADPLLATPTMTAASPKPAPLLRWLPAALVVVIAAVAVGLGWHQHLTPTGLADIRDHSQAFIAAHTAVSVLIYIAAYTAAVALSLPGALLLTLAGGLLFGWLLGGIAAVLAATLGASIVFWIAQTAAGEALTRRAGPHIAKLSQGFKDNAFSYMLFLRLVPAFPFFIVNIVPALLGVPFRTFVAGTLLGIVPGAFAYSFAGAGLDEVLASAKAAQATCLVAKSVTECPLSVQLTHLVTPELKVAFALLSVLALLPAVVKHWRQRHGH